MIEFTTVLQAAQNIARYLSTMSDSTVLFDNVGLAQYRADLSMAITGETSMTGDTSASVLDYCSSWITIMNYVWQQQEAQLLISGVVIDEVTITSIDIAWVDGPVNQTATINAFSLATATINGEQSFAIGDLKVVTKRVA